MKAKIKKTGEIINIAEYAKIELDVCDSYGNPISVRPEDVELIPDVKEDNFPKIDWEQRRYEIAKRMLLYAAETSRSILMSGHGLGDEAKGKTFEEVCASSAISFADVLIKVLKGETEQAKEEPIEHKLEGVEVKIGSTIKIEGVDYACAIGIENDCCSCDFLLIDGDCAAPNWLKCHSCNRKDGKDVIFIKKRS